MKRQFTPTHVRMLPSNMLLPNLILPESHPANRRDCFNTHAC
jgi:hypothetical protein